MREIKFRGKRLSDGEWLCGYHLEKGGMHYISPYRKSERIAAREEYRVDKNTITMSTGVSDFKGNEVWVGDILEISNSSSPLIYNLLLEYTEFGLGCIRRPKYGNPLFLDWDTLTERVRYVVIGNIHDNPELIKQ